MLRLVPIIAIAIVALGCKSDPEPAPSNPEPPAPTRAPEDATEPEPEPADLSGARLAMVTTHGTYIPLPLSSVPWGSKLLAGIDDDPNPLDADYETPEDASRAIAEVLAKVPEVPDELAIGAAWNVLGAKGPHACKVAGYQATNIGEYVIMVRLEPPLRTLGPWSDPGGASMVFTHASLSDKPTPTLAVPRTLPEGIAWAPLEAFEPKAATGWPARLAKALEPRLPTDDPTGLHALISRAKPEHIWVNAFTVAHPGEHAAIAVLTVRDESAEPDARMACSWMASALVWVDGAGELLAPVPDPGAPVDRELGCGTVLFRIAQAGLPDALVYELPVWTTTSAAVYQWRGDELVRQKVYSHGFD